MPPPAGNSWERYQHLVLSRLDTLDERINCLTRKVDQIRVDSLTKLWTEVAVLKMKAGAWGLLGAAIPVAIMLMVSILTRGGKP